MFLLLIIVSPTFRSDRGNNVALFAIGIVDQGNPERTDLDRIQSRIYRSRNIKFVSFKINLTISPLMSTTSVTNCDLCLDYFALPVFSSLLVNDSLGPEFELSSSNVWPLISHAFLVMSAYILLLA